MCENLSRTAYPSSSLPTLNLWSRKRSRKWSYVHEAVARQPSMASVIMHGRRGFSNRSRNCSNVTSFALIRGTSSPRFDTDKTSGSSAKPCLRHSPPETESSERVARFAARMRFSMRSTGESEACLRGLAPEEGALASSS